MENIIIGNAVMLVGASLMSIIGLLKNKKTIIAAQTGQIALMTAGSLLLGSIPGAVVNALSIIRNLLCYNGKLNKTMKGILILLTITISVLFNNIGVVGFLPIIATVSFIVFMDTENVANLKWLIIITAAMWMIHDIYIQAYAVVPFDLLTIVTNLATIISIKKKATVTC